MNTLEKYIGDYTGWAEIIGVTRNPKTGGRELIYECKYCGNIKQAERTNLYKRMKSCGCKKEEFTGKHERRQNEYTFMSNYIIGHIRNTDSIFYIDTDDYVKIKDLCWHNDPTGYVVSIARKLDTSPEEAYSNSPIFMHRLIMNLSKDNPLKIDHINHNRMDNRKENLRIVTLSQNAMNSHTSQKNTSGVKGVSRVSKNGKWRAYITINKKQISLGHYNTFEEAVAARKAAEKEYFGEYAYDSQKDVTILRG